MLTQISGAIAATALTLLTSTLPSFPSADTAAALAPPRPTTETPRPLDADEKATLVTFFGSVERIALDPNRARMDTPEGGVAQDFYPAAPDVLDSSEKLLSVSWKVDLDRARRAGNLVETCADTIGRYDQGMPDWESTSCYAITLEGTRITGAEPIEKLTIGVSRGPEIVPLETGAPVLPDGSAAPPAPSLKPATVTPGESMHAADDPPTGIHGFRKWKAAEYAQRWAKEWNPDYVRYEQDCTNFASQAMAHGGWGQIDDALGSARLVSYRFPNQWFHRNSWKGDVAGRSFSWGGAQNFNRFGVHEVKRLTLMSTFPELRRGDVLQSQKKKEPNNISHSMIVTTRRGKEVRLSYHSAGDVTHRNIAINTVLKKNSLNDFWYFPLSS